MLVRNTEFLLLGTAEFAGFSGERRYRDCAEPSPRVNVARTATRVPLGNVSVIG